MSRHRSKLRTAVVLLAPLALAACSEGTIPTEPGGPLFHETGEAHNHYVLVCKVGEIGTDATFSVTATGGTVLPIVVGGEVTVDAAPDLNDPSCVEVWESTDATTVQVTVTEVDMTEGTILDNIVVMGSLGSVIDVPGGTVTVDVSNAEGAQILFKNIGESEERGLEGCTPGFWRQEQHYEFWTDYAPGDAWTTVFDDPGSQMEPGKNGATFDATTTLGEAVLFGGGGIFALARHAVAALLNASSPDTDYPLTIAEIQDLVNDAIASGEFEDAKNELVGYNELGCDVKESESES